MARPFIHNLLFQTWLISEAAIPAYEPLVKQLMEGQVIETGWFSQLELPPVPGNIAMVVLNGVLTKADVCNAPGYRSLTKQLNAAVANPDIDGIILLSENCPGGQVDGVMELSNAIDAAKKIKPVIGAISGGTFSAGTWLSSRCNEVYCTLPSDVVGCIGTRATIRRPQGENANYIDVISDLSPDKGVEARDPEAYKANILNPLTELFHNAVKTGRGDRLKLEKENVLSGKSYIAAKAQDAGLVDGVMSFNRIIARTLFIKNNLYK